MKHCLAAILLILAGPALAERLVTPDEFEALSTGKTLYFTQNGQPYGAERYFENRESAWQYADGTCVYGRWFEAGEAICFVYENASLRPQCWYFAERDGQYYARTVDTPAGSLSELLMSHEDTEPLECPGPDLGV